MANWRFSVGRKGISRITVYERPDASCIYLEYWDADGRHREAFKSATGKTITDRELAKKLARKMSEAQEQRRNQSAAEMLGVPTGRTVSDVLDHMHAARSREWSSHYKIAQARYRKFWTAKLGRARLTTVNAALVERIVKEAAAEHEKGGGAPWKARTVTAYLNYIVQAFKFAERKLKWIEPRHNLSAVEFPKPRSRAKAYTLAEARKLLPALEADDWRMGFIGHVALQTGRRLSAIRMLPEREGWVEFVEDYAVMRFPEDTDKARAPGEAVVAGKEAVELVRRAAREWRTPSAATCHRALKRAEDAAGVEWKRGRGWHAFKRLWATLASGHPGRERQSGTTRNILDRVYVQDVLEPKVDLARQLAGRLGAE